LRQARGLSLVMPRMARNARTQASHHVLGVGAVARQAARQGIGFVKEGQTIAENRA
jgi:hypothetical protein